MCGRDPEVHDPGLADLERRHGPANGPPRVDRTGHRPCPGDIAGATRADIQRALWEDRTLVKTFGPRGAVHLLSSEGLGREYCAR